MLEISKNLDISMPTTKK